MAASVIAIGLLAGAATSQADTDSRPLAVPLIGTQGIASQYPSTLTVSPPGGATQKGPVTVVLHRVTHPCPEHLAVLLVHDMPSATYLLMSNAGGCRPLEGTDLAFSAPQPPLPDDEPVSPAHGHLTHLSASNYGTVPAFPAPAPAGPYTLGMPPSNGIVAGAWSLYVIDTTEGGRGVIAGGWSLQYDNVFLTSAGVTNVAVPASMTGAGSAAHYPINIDLTGAREDARVDFVACRLVLDHTYTDDLRIVLQSPAGTAIALMINAGGAFDLAPSTMLTFSDFGAAPAPDNAQMITAGYQPGGIYGQAILPLPAPPGPYATAFSAFTGEPVKGTWKLYVYDDKLLDTGTINTVTLFIGTHGPPDLSEVTPPNGTVSTQPFVRVEGRIQNAMPDPSVAYSATWRVVLGASSTFYAGGIFTFRPGTSTFYADVPVKQGVNHLTVTVQNPHGDASVRNIALDVDEFTYALAEGATGGFFDTDVTIGNATGTAAPVSIDFLPESSPTVTHDDQVAANAPRQVHVDDFVPGDAVSTVVHSTNAVPLAVERTMSWDARGYGGHGGGATAPALEWLFAEGSQGYFDTYLLLANGGTVDSHVTVRFLLEGGGVVMQAIAVPPQSRRTIYAGNIAALVNQSFGIDVIASRPIIAERAMYFPHGSARVFEGGHESAGVNQTSQNWFLAEGATGPFFETFVLLMNPTDGPAQVSLTYLLPNGDTVAQSIALAANSRQTINIETVDAKLANAAVSTRVTSDIGIIVERAMYWPDVSQGWQEAHNSFGVTELGLRWGLADGRLGGTRGYETYVLLANPNPLPSEVRVRFLKEGATVTRAYTLPPTSRLNIQTSQDAPEIGEGVFTVEVEVLNFVPIAVEKAMYWNSEGSVWAAGTDVTATRLPPP
jgi:hypothetical protein